MKILVFRTNSLDKVGMHIFLAGATGLVGSNFARAAKRRGHTVTGVAHQFPGSIDGVQKLVRGDLRDPEWTTSLILDCFPDAIVNAAAVSSPEACEADPELAHALNVSLPALLARLANHFSARFIQLSSDLVFDGTRGAYSPTDPPSPLSQYGQQKAQAEEDVLRSAPDFATVLRVPILTGNSPSGQQSLHEKLFAVWANGGTAHLFEDEIRQPCSAENLASALVELCERTDTAGIYHWAGADSLSRLEMGRRIQRHFNLPESLIVPSSAGNNSTSIRRPLNLTLDIRKLAGRSKTRPQTFADQLEALAIPPAARAWYHSL